MESIKVVIRFSRNSLCLSTHGVLRQSDIKMNASRRKNVVKWENKVEAKNVLIRSRLAPIIYKRGTRSSQIYAIELNKETKEWYSGYEVDGT